MRRRLLNKWMASSTVKTILNPRRKRSRISIRQKAVAVAVRVELWGPLVMDLRMVGRDYYGPTSIGNPWEAYS